MQDAVAGASSAEWWSFGRDFKRERGEDVFWSVGSVALGRLRVVQEAGRVGFHCLEEEPCDGLWGHFEIELQETGGKVLNQGLQKM